MTKLHAARLFIALPPRRSAVRVAACCAALFSLSSPRAARGQAPTPGYPEAVIQWGVQKKETCADVARAVYGSEQHIGMIHRYNRVACDGPLREGLTLVLPARVTNLPDAKLRSFKPDVMARPPGGGWSPASTGQPLFSSYNVNTLTDGRADIEFIDRTRVFLAPNTLVVIYGTASQTHVSKTPPVAIDVQSGEVKAGLAALRDGTVEVGVEGGGRVSLASRDGLVQKKGDRTTVSVYDGTAKVASAGAIVDVPTNYGTRFVRAKPPAPPRPLPEAPLWEGGDGARIVFVEGDSGRLNATWQAVTTAVGYRVEVARDAEFHDYVVRQEVGGDVHALAAEQFPLGSYYVTVRAIDKEEYLGVAAKTLPVKLTKLALEAGAHVTDGAFEVSPYARVRFPDASNLEIAIDDGKFGPVPTVVDFKRLAPKRLRFRAGTGERAFEVRYKVPEAKITTLDSFQRVGVRFTGVDDLDIGTEAHPALRIHDLGGVRNAALEKSADMFVANVGDVKGPVRVDVVDDQGRVLGSDVVDLHQAPVETPVKREPPLPVIGPTAPLWAPSIAYGVSAWAPTARNAASVSAVLAREADDAHPEVRIRAGGSIGMFSVDAAFESNRTPEDRTEQAVWLGGRITMIRLGRADLEVAPTLRFAIPVNQDAPPARFEPGVAFGGAAGRLTWLVDTAVRVRTTNDHGVAGAPPALGYGIAGVTYDFLPWVRAHTMVDAGGFKLDGQDPRFQGGLTLGFEAGETAFVGAGARLAPFHDDRAGAVTAQVAVGVRGGP